MNDFLHDSCTGVSMAVLSRSINRTLVWDIYYLEHSTLNCINMLTMNHGLKQPTTRFLISVIWFRCQDIYLRIMNS